MDAGTTLGSPPRGVRRRSPATCPMRRGRVARPHATKAWDRPWARLLPVSEFSGFEVEALEAAGGTVHQSDPTPMPGREDRTLRRGLPVPFRVAIRGSPADCPRSRTQCDPARVDQPVCG